ncbi:hypothetical protein EVAR_89015_1 [Eumeta japonica]|uniref:Uncharacterized protein n=1 Tax=Eumeta variegata TaxID=151549 RepID=A0A4C1XBY3_EUMVA|nr:hypothetical protein EVAR_89015_1 [Eumeta japonica]
MQAFRSYDVDSDKLSIDFHNKYSDISAQNSPPESPKSKELPQEMLVIRHVDWPKACCGLQMSKNTHKPFTFSADKAKGRRSKFHTCVSQQWWQGDGGRTPRTRRRRILILSPLSPDEFKLPVSDVS